MNDTENGSDEVLTTRTLNGSAREFMLKCAQDAALYKEFLNIVARFPRFSIMNLTHVYEREPNAHILLDVDAWKKKGYSIDTSKKGVAFVVRDKTQQDTEKFPKFAVAHYFSENDLTKSYAGYLPSYNSEIYARAKEQVTQEFPTTEDAQFVALRHFGEEIEAPVVNLSHLLCHSDVSENVKSVKTYLEQMRSSAWKYISAVRSAYFTLLKDEQEHTFTEKLDHAEHLAGLDDLSEEDITF